jgi:hypothetical protein
MHIAKIDIAPYPLGQTADVEWAASKPTAD